MSARKRRVVVPSPRPTAAREIQLIGRVEEMGLLREAADRAVRGEGGVARVMLSQKYLESKSHLKKEKLHN